MEALRRTLHLDVAPWRELPDDLITLAFNQPSYTPRKEERNALEQQYGTYHLEDFEVLGDAVLEMVVTELLFYRIQGPGDLSRIRSELVRNTTLYSFMARDNLCQYIQGQGKMTVKDCADVFEALVGALYYWISRQNTGDAIVQVGKYLRMWWYTDNVLEKVLRGQSIDVDPHTGRSLRPKGKEARIARSPSPLRRTRSKR